jgi:hypothetical protein
MHNLKTVLWNQDLLCSVHPVVVSKVLPFPFAPWAIRISLIEVLV